MFLWSCVNRVEIIIHEQVLNPEIKYVLKSN